MPPKQSSRKPARSTARGRVPSDKKDGWFLCPYCQSATSNRRSVNDHFRRKHSNAFNPPYKEHVCTYDKQRAGMSEKAQREFVKGEHERMKAEFVAAKAKASGGQYGDGDDGYENSGGDWEGEGDEGTGNQVRNPVELDDYQEAQEPPHMSLNRPRQSTSNTYSGSSAPLPYKPVPDDFYSGRFAGRLVGTGQQQHSALSSHQLLGGSRFENNQSDGFSDYLVDRSQEQYPALGFGQQPGDPFIQNNQSGGHSSRLFYNQEQYPALGFGQQPGDPFIQNNQFGGSNQSQQVQVGHRSQQGDMLPTAHPMQHPRLQSTPLHREPRFPTQRANQDFIQGLDLALNPRKADELPSSQRGQNLQFGQSSQSSVPRRQHPAGSHIHPDAKKLDDGKRVRGFGIIQGRDAEFYPDYPPNHQVPEHEILTDDGSVSSED